MTDSVIPLDTLDRRLIRLLQSNARANYQELAESIGMSASTVRRRIERLVANNLLTFVAFPTWEAMGFNFVAFIGISVDLPHLRSVSVKLAEMDEICFVTLTTGAFDIVAQVVLPTNADMVRFSTDRIAPIEGIRSMQTLMIPEIVKGYNDYRIPKMSDPFYADVGTKLNVQRTERVAAG